MFVRVSVCACMCACVCARLHVWMLSACHSKGEAWVSRSPNPLIFSQHPIIRNSAWGPYVWHTTLCRMRESMVLHKVQHVGRAKMGRDT